LLLLPGLLSCVLAQGVARADTPSPAGDEQKAAARMLGTEGVKLALSGDCIHAVDKLTRAEALVHAPTTAVPLAQCDIQLGKLVAGTEILNRVLRETLAENAPKPWVDARKRAQLLLDATEPRIAKLRVHVDRPAGATGDVQITIDGEPMPAVLLDNDRPTDPGRHHVIASAQGFASAESDVGLADGQSQTLSLRLEPQSVAPPPFPPQALPSQPGPQPPQPLGTPGQPPAPQPTSPDRTAGFIVLGVGAAGIAVGTLFGVLALGAKSSLDSACVPTKASCPSSSQGDIDALHTDSIVSTVGWGVGAVGAALGVYLILTAHGDENPKAAGVNVHPWLGAGSAGVAGTFP
jgi:hypothetical protein